MELRKIVCTFSVSNVFLEAALKRLRYERTMKKMKQTMRTESVSYKVIEYDVYELDA